MKIALWIVQVLLAGLFLLSGGMKAAMPAAGLAENMLWVADSPWWLPKLIGISEVLGAIGLILPAALRVLPVLTPVAASALGVVMLLAMGMHAMYAEYGAIGMNAVILLMCAFVAWGRFVKEPVQPR